jgi:hypothetical protein
MAVIHFPHWCNHCRVMFDDLDVGDAIPKQAEYMDQMPETLSGKAIKWRCPECHLMNTTYVKLAKPNDLLVGPERKPVMAKGLELAGLVEEKPE